MLKPEENPPVIWPEEVPLCDFEGIWRVAHTKSRNEKALAWQMKRTGIQYFLPMSWKVQKKRARTTRSLLPLFTGYVFFCGGENSRLEVLKTNRVANIIEVKDQQKLVEDLTPIELLLRKGASLEPHKYIKAGQKCRVIAGPLMGAEGIVSKSSRNTRLILQVDMLGQATSVEIDSELLEVVNDI